MQSDRAEGLSSLGYTEIRLQTRDLSERTHMGRGPVAASQERTESRANSLHPIIMHKAGKEGVLSQERLSSLFTE